MIKPYKDVLINGKIIDANAVMESIDNGDGEYNRDEIYCPCGCAQLSYVKNTDRKSHFRAKRGSIHRDDCEHKLSGINIRENNSYFQEKETPENIDSELDWMSRKLINSDLMKCQRKENNSKNNEPSDYVVDVESSRGTKYSKPSRSHLKFTNHFRDDIMQQLPNTQDELIIYCYGEVTLEHRKRRINKEWNDLYVVRLLNGKKSLLFNLLCPLERNHEDYVPKSMRELKKAAELISGGKIEKVYFSGLIKFQRNGNYLNAYIYKKNDEKANVEGLLLKE